MCYARLSDLQGYICQELLQGSNSTNSFMFCIFSRNGKSANIWEAVENKRTKNRLDRKNEKAERRNSKLKGK